MRADVAARLRLTLEHDVGQIGAPDVKFKTRIRKPLAEPIPPLCVLVAASPFDAAPLPALVELDLAADGQTGVLAVAGPVDPAFSMIVKLRQPKREIELPGGRTVNQLLDSLGMNRESYLVIRNGTLAPGSNSTIWSATLAPPC